MNSARRAHDAVRAAAAFIRDEGARFPGGAGPASPGEIAVLALKVYGVFLDTLADKEEIAAAIVEASRRFDATA